MKQVDVDCKERIEIALTFLLQSYKVLMGSMVLLFVPRSCDERVCSVTDNIYNTENINLAGMAFNFITVLSFMAVYVAELKRENWCIHNFDIDHNVSDNNLAIVLKDKPNLSSSLNYYNRLYKNMTLGCFFIFSINFIISNIILYNDEIFWTIGLAPYFSYMILVLMKIYNCYYISSHSIANNKALSAYMTEFTSFNIIDKDMLEIEVLTDNENAIVYPGEAKETVPEPLPFMLPNPIP